MTGKQLLIPYRSQSNSRDTRDTFRHRSTNNTSLSNSKSCYGNSNLKHPSKTGSPYPRQQNFLKKSNYSNFNTYSSNSRPQSSNYNRDGDRSRQLFSRNRHQNVRN